MNYTIGKLKVYEIVLQFYGITILGTFHFSNFSTKKERGRFLIKSVKVMCYKLKTVVER